MKKILGWIGSNLFYHIGDTACRLSVKKPFRNSQLIGDIYQRSMKISIEIQDWAGNTGPWKKTK